ncbi:MAG: peptidoglycan DD-metalloendopeptidase family protein [Tannerellaceae bacterium]|jgi:septal ring factor EnvC (AmiA/AmiB activator)|nr:peptidoglycan DD-metalloendopeptidase family protein [Tannerellaceae bacterium]
MLWVLTAFGQKSAKIRELENQRKAALNEIELTNRLLSETKESAENSLNRLNLLSQQIQQRRRVISLLNQELAVIDNEITSIRNEIVILEKELHLKRGNYGASIQKLQRHYTSQDKLLFILSAENFSQSFRRMRYLREYADWQKKQATEISGRQKSIRAKWEALEKTRTEKQSLLSTREEETRNLEEEEVLQQKEIDELNRKQRQLQDELKKKQRQAEALNRQIEKQIVEEVARAEAEARASREREERTRESAGGKPKTDSGKRVADSKGGYAMTREEKQLSDNFASNRGKLPVPVTGQYTIVGVYGEQQHQDLKYVRVVNNGIDIQATANSEARAVFDGKVTSIFVQRGFNNSVIIRHGNYLTVYSNLSAVYVKQGDVVKARQSIGKVFTDSENDNATILHFELWKEKDKQNPQPWLRR